MLTITNDGYGSFTVTLPVSLAVAHRAMVRDLAPVAMDGNVSEGWLVTCDPHDFGPTPPGVAMPAVPAIIAGPIINVGVFFCDAVPTIQVGVYVDSSDPLDHTLPAPTELDLDATLAVASVIRTLIRG